jgi:hypothetical protein
MLAGVGLGCMAVYANDTYHGQRYNDNWDNPFYNIIFFLFIGVIESLILFIQILNILL